MRLSVLIRAFPALLALLLSAVLPLRAQTHWGAIGYGGGAISYGDFVTSGGSLQLDPTWLVNGQAEWWYGGRLGVRVNGAVNQVPFEVEEGVSRDLATWLLDGDVLLRPLPAAPGRMVAPFVSIGAGVINYGLGSGEAREFPGANAVYPGDTERQFAVVGGLGIDIIPARLMLWDTDLAFRLEVADHVALESPFEDAEGDSFGPIHNIRVTLGVLGLVDRLW